MCDQRAPDFMARMLGKELFCLWELTHATSTETLSEEVKGYSYIKPPILINRNN